MKDASRRAAADPTRRSEGRLPRVTIKLGHCESIAPGKSREIGVKYFLPLTGPANFTLKTGGTTYGLDAGPPQGGRRPSNPRRPAAGPPARRRRGTRRGPTTRVGPVALWRTPRGLEDQDPRQLPGLDHPGTWATTHLIGSQDGNGEPGVEHRSRRRVPPAGFRIHHGQARTAAVASGAERGELAAGVGCRVVQDGRCFAVLELHRRAAGAPGRRNPRDGKARIGLLAAIRAHVLEADRQQQAERVRTNSWCGCTP
ncbi:chitinase C-terminal domain-containing protein [Streptomyces clavuligerus]|uniref:chitinase C-terminal domain-containing protein n=1 Tax=Streptomyces clavuligerus TaxID=1901 RepID=UPI0023DE09BB|nr:chitinase C-terminal domain-containing protein [Streptomyces clavuligerus]